MTCRNPKLKFNRECVPYWASVYKFKDETPVDQLVGQVQKRGYLRRSELKTVGKWKSRRSAGKIDNNERSLVLEVTRFALHTTCDKAAIESLTILHGVGAPTASVILHFFHKQDYPILDFRALWSVSLIEGDKYSYSYALWSDYVKFCREEAKEADVCMRDLDRALWQYSKSNPL